MLLIVIFLIVEIWPIWVILDGNFVDIFLKYSVLIEQKDLKAPLLFGNQDVDRNDIEAMRDLYSFQNTISYASSTRQSDLLFNINQDQSRFKQYNSPFDLGGQRSGRALS